MKKRVFIGVLFAILVLVLMPCATAKEEGMEREVFEGFSDLSEVLPDDIVSLLPDGFFDKDMETSAEGVRQAGRFSYFLGVVLDIIGLHLGDALSLFASLLGLLLISALAERIRGLFHTDMLRSAFTLAVSSALLACVVSLQYRFLSDVFAFFDRLSMLVNGMIPLTGALYAMGGNVSTAVVSNAGLMMFLNLVENFCTVALRAAVGICTALAICSCFTPNISFTGIINFVKRIYTFSLGFLMLLLSFSLI